ncbi:DegV family protein [Corynebacterium sp. TAE3-ERU12]|uniref:DegV family protein n=1 Tax=Corynebacterium sp. TAE3-ERU12 TaxID=2849491 RepID=UPI001C491D9C|nr:DegV family protein [Corynebacterium sp. TAE3-ERU12]MBV7294990.1 DegV family protein [Corynebacterium sp. TAE3-ERU12]
MPYQVQVIVDDGSCITEQQAEKYGITVLELPVNTDGDEPTTSAIQPLPLCAAYARAQERGQDAGVVAIHIGSALSSTYSNAVAAAEAVGGVDVIDSKAAGAGLAVAAIAAAKAARRGADRQRCAEIAQESLNRSYLWGYVPKLDTMRRGGRISTGQVVLSTALAMKPMIGLSDGQLRVAAKCRTEQKLLETIVSRCTDAAGAKPVECVVQTAGESTVGEQLAQILPTVLPVDSVVRSVDLPASVIVHTGPNACFVSLVASPDVADYAPADAEPDTQRTHPHTPGVTTIEAKLPTWSENRRAARERAESLARAISDFTHRDHTDADKAGADKADKAAPGPEDAPDPGDESCPEADSASDKH